MTNDKYEDLMKTESELAEVLLGLLKQQQNAIVHFRDSEMLSIVEKQQNILRPFEALEKERAELTKHGKHPNEEETQHYRSKLRSLVHQIIETNSQNKFLLENSLKFIQQNLRIITDGYTKQLLDAKI